MQMKLIIDAELVNVKNIAVRRWKSRSSSKVTASWEKRFYFFRRVVNVSVHIVLGKYSCCPHFRKYLGNWCSQCPKMTAHCSFSIKLSETWAKLTTTDAPSFTIIRTEPTEPPLFPNFPFDSNEDKETWDQARQMFFFSQMWFASSVEISESF